jgi:hypothetical protein
LAGFVFVDPFDPDGPFEVVVVVDGASFVFFVAAFEAEEVALEPPGDGLFDLGAAVTIAAGPAPTRANATKATAASRVPDRRSRDKFVPSAPPLRVGRLPHRSLPLHRQNLEKA